LVGDAENEDAEREVLCWFRVTPHGYATVSFVQLKGYVFQGTGR
jgi:hypothetical protein